MGNGSSSAAINASASNTATSCLSEISSVEYQKGLGNSRFLKSFRGRHQNVLVVAKIFVKPMESSMEKTLLDTHIRLLREQMEACSEMTNVLTYKSIFETEKAVYAIRQYLMSNLYDRISTRPFLNLLEKKWITFQLLSAFSEIHSKNNMINRFIHISVSFAIYCFTLNARCGHCHVCHGDIKTENILVTSWNWVYITDFAAFKPTYLPEDNPADFSYYFDSSLRRTCYVAPERFIAIQKQPSPASSQLQPSMDIFSLGCVICELFLEGAPVLSLSQLLKYRSGEFKLDVELLRNIEQPEELLAHMMQLDPGKRSSADDYLVKCQHLFPHYFRTFLYQYFSSISDQKISSSDGNLSFSETDLRLSRIYNEFDKIAYFLGFTNHAAAVTKSFNAPPMSPHHFDTRNNVTFSPPTQDLLNMHLNIPNYQLRHGMAISQPPDDGAVIFLALITSCLRNVSSITSKLQALDLLFATSMHLNDEFKLDRALPFFVYLLVADERTLVRCHALKYMTRLMISVVDVAASNANIFSDYILPSLHSFSTDSEVMVRVTFAKCISSLVETALRFLEISQIIKTPKQLMDNDVDGGLLLQSTYDAKLMELKDVIQEHVTNLLLDSESCVKQALLHHITFLCISFGRQKSNDVLLSHMITFLNAKDWQLRSAFFENIAGVATFVGGHSLEHYILPLMMQALHDHEEFVVVKVLHALVTLASTRNHFNRMKLRSLTASVIPLCLHPNSWIRNSLSLAPQLTESFRFRSSAPPSLRPVMVAVVGIEFESMQPVDLQCLLMPLMLPVLSSEAAWSVNFASSSLPPPTTTSPFPEATAFLHRHPLNLLLSGLKAPLSRKEFELGISAAAQSRLQSELQLAAHEGLSPRVRPHRNVSVIPMELPNIDRSVFEEQMKALEINEEARLKLLLLVSFVATHRDVSAQTKELTRLSNQASDDDNRTRFLSITPQTHFLVPLKLEEAAFVTESIESSNPTTPTAVEPATPLTSNPSSTSQLQHFGSRRSLENIYSDATSRLENLTPKHRHSLVDGTNLTGANAKIDTSLMNGSVPVVSALSTHVRPAPTTPSPATPISIPKNVKNLDFSPLCPASSPQLRSTPSTSTSIATIYIATATAPLTFIPPRPSTHSRHHSRVNSERSHEPPLSPTFSMFQKSNHFSATFHLSSLLLNKSHALFPPPLEALGVFVNRNRPVTSTANNSTNSTASTSSRSKPQPHSSDKRHNRDLSSSAVDSWRPLGDLVTEFREHKERVNVISVAPSHHFFATASDDATVKVWDCLRLERNVTMRSRATIKFSHPVRCLTFCENSHALAAASDNGSIQLIRIEYSSPSAAETASSATSPSSASRFIQYVKLPALDFSVSDSNLSDHVTCLTHFNHNAATATSSLLMYATARGRVVAHDLRMSRAVFSMQHPCYLGSPTSMVQEERDHGWMVLGSDRGVFSCWDLRFRVMWNKWSLPRHQRIHQLSNVKRSSWHAGTVRQDKLIFSCHDNNEACMWDLETASCKRVFSARPADFVTPPFSHFQTCSPPAGADLSERLSALSSIKSATAEKSATTHSMRAALIPSEGQYMITGGSDRTIRYWDLKDTDKSFILGGARSQEHLSPSSTTPPPSQTAYRDFASESMVFTHECSLPSTRQPTASSSMNSGFNHLPNQMISTQHQDCITDLAMTAYPYPMLISSSRDGVIKVWK